MAIQRHQASENKAYGDVKTNGEIAAEAQRK